MNKEINKFEDLVGETLTGIVDEGDEIYIYTVAGGIYKLYHAQDCCESVTVEDIIGDLDDLIGTPLTMAEEISNAYPSVCLCGMMVQFFLRKEKRS